MFLMILNALVNIPIVAIEISANDGQVYDGFIKPGTNLIGSPFEIYQPMKGKHCKGKFLVSTMEIN